MKKISKIFIGIFLLVLPFSAFAHERDVFTIGNNEYLFTIGSLNEPVYVGDKTGVDLRVKMAHPTENPPDATRPSALPVSGLEKTLKVEIAAGDQKKIFDISPAYNDPGAYHVPFYPTVQTTYKYRVFGTIDTTPVDLTFTCNPAGHPQVADDTSAVSISSGVTRKLHAGAFGCPKAREEIAFPTLSTPKNSQGQGLATSALAISIVALVLSSKRRRA